MKTISKSLFIVGALFLSHSFVSCSDDDVKDKVNKVVELSIGEFVTTTADYSSLAAALKATDLMSVVNDESNTLTVFAPNNAAFSAFLSAKGFTNGLADIDTDEEIALVKNILLNHVIVGSELKAAAVIDSAPGYVKNAAVGPENVAKKATNLSTFYAVESDKVKINGDVTVTAADAFDANNGIVHAVDKVIDLPKISTFAIADKRLSKLTELLVKQNLVATVDGLNPATVFAPLDDAFTKLAAVPEGDALTTVLTYHVIGGANAEASDLPSLGATTPETEQTQTIAISSATSIKGNGNTEAVKFVLNDIQAINGIVHAIDGVLLPEN